MKGFEAVEPRYREDHLNDSPLGKKESLIFAPLLKNTILTYISFSKWFEGTVQILSKMLPVWGQLGGDETEMLEN